MHNKKLLVYRGKGGIDTYLGYMQNLIVIILNVTGTKECFRGKDIHCCMARCILSSHGRISQALLQFTVYSFIATIYFVSNNHIPYIFSSSSTCENKCF